MAFLSDRYISNYLNNCGTTRKSGHISPTHMGAAWRRQRWTAINGLLLAGSRVVGGRWLPIFAWSELASAEWLALGI